MAKNQYHEEQDVINEERLERILNDLPDFSRLYFKEKKAKGSIRTCVQYAYDIRDFFKFIQNSAGFSNKDIRSMNISFLEKLTLEDIQEYKDATEYYYKKGKKIRKSDAAQARKISSLKSFFAFYHKGGYIKSGMYALISVPTVESPDPEDIIVMNKNEIKRLFDAINDESGLTGRKLTVKKKTKSRDIAIFMTLFGTGLRISELVGINLSDIDFIEKKISIIRKGGKPRSVYFSDIVCESLKSYIHNDRDAFAPTQKDIDALFLSMQHNRLSTGSIESLMRNYNKKAGFSENYTPHKCRATYGTELYNQTGDIALVADALNHSSIETTKRHYASSKGENMRKAANLSESLFDNMD